MYMHSWMHESNSWLLIRHSAFCSHSLFSTSCFLLHTHLIGRQHSVTEPGCKLKKQSILHHTVRHCQKLKLNMAPFIKLMLLERIMITNLRALLSLCKAASWCNLSNWRVARSIRQDEVLRLWKWKRLSIKMEMVEQQQSFGLPCCFPSITLGGQGWSWIGSLPAPVLVLLLHSLIQGAFGEPAQEVKWQENIVIGFELRGLWWSKDCAHTHGGVLWQN